MRARYLIRTFLLGLAALAVASPMAAAGGMDGWDRIGAKVDIIGDNSGSISGAGFDISVKGMTRQSVRLMGGTVQYDGHTDENLWVAGYDVDISGEVVRDATIWGNKILLNAFVGGSATLRGSEIVIEENAAISQGFYASADKVTFGGASIGPVELSGREVIFSGSARSGLVIRALSVKITDAARITGDVTIHATGQPDISTEAKISGRVVTGRMGQWQVMRRTYGKRLIVSISLAFIAAMATFITGLFTLGLARNGVEKIIDNMVEQTFKCGIWGVSALIAIPLLASLLMLTLIGAPLAATLIMTLPLIVLLALSATGFAAGEWIFNRTGDEMSLLQRILSLGTGLLIIAIAAILPYVGTVFLALAIIFGTGALFLLLREMFGPEPDYKTHYRAR